MEKIKRIVIWIVGKDLFAQKSRQVGDIHLHVSKPPRFEYAPTGDYYSITICINAAPNFIHRGLQILCFGVKYRMIDNK